MRRNLTFLFLACCLFSCSTKKTDEQQVTVPAGMSIRSVFTTRMDNNLPVDDITYLPPTLNEIVIYTTFDGISTTQHNYQWKLERTDSIATCPQEDPYYWTPGGSSENVWTRISVSKCLSVPGDYTMKVFLDGNCVLIKSLRVLSEEDINSGKFEVYWNKDKYLPILPQAKMKQNRDWIVKNIGEDASSLTNLFVAVHNGFNRVFAVGKTDDNYVVKELTNYGMLDVFKFERGERDQPWNLQYKLIGNELYLYNSLVKNSYNLETSEVKSNITLPFTPNLEGFTSPDGQHVITRKGMLDGKPANNVSSCSNPEVSWASWSADSRTVLYKVNCQKQETESGIYQRDLNSGQSKRILEEFEWTTSFSYFNNNGSDFVALVEKEEEVFVTKIKFTTQNQFYAELGFGANYYWSRQFGLPLEERIVDDPPLSVNFLSAPEELMSYSNLMDEVGSSKEGSIFRLGTLKGGSFDGKDLYRIRDLELSEGKGGPPNVYYTIDNSFLIRNGDALVIINALQTSDNRDTYLFPDPDGKRKKSPLFSGAAKVINYKNQLISDLFSAYKISLPNSSVMLHRLGIVPNPEEKKNYRKILDHPQEGEIYVKENDDGSFWKFNGDQTATLYRYEFTFGVTLNGESLDMNEYAPYTNHDCFQTPIDLAHLLTPDPSRLRQAGETTDKEPIYVFNSDNDEILKKEYDLLRQGYEEYEQTFKSFKEFVASNPLFLWKDPFGRYVRFVRKENLNPTNCEPILYLYPQTTTDVKVQLGNKINVIASKPELNNFWHVRAESNGELVDVTTSKNYDRIFWEGISDFLPPLKKGFVTDTAHLDKFFTEKLQTLGLNARETADFKNAWLKEFKDAPYYFIGFYDQHLIDRYAPMEVTPAPETVIRILMDFRPLKELIPVEEPVYSNAPQRKGFTVVEWSGLKR